MILVIATSNRSKFREFCELLDLDGLTLRSLADFPVLPLAEEPGTSFAENAWQKAACYHRRLQLAVVADDSGLEVDLLEGKPGILSARYAGPKASDSDNVQKLLRELQEVTDRRQRSQLGAAGVGCDQPGLPGKLAPLQDRGASSCRLLSPARFVCALSLFSCGQEQFAAEGTCEGFIIDRPRGSGGFGYDPVFFMPSEGRTMAELSAADKNRISHRGAAVSKLRGFLGETMLETDDKGSFRL